MARLVVGAHYGLKDWLAQRITAVVMAAYTLMLVVAVFCGVAQSQVAWREFMVLSVSARLASSMP